MTISELLTIYNLNSKTYLTEVQFLKFYLALRFHKEDPINRLARIYKEDHDNSTYMSYSSKDITINQYTKELADSLEDSNFKSATKVNDLIELIIEYKANQLEIQDNYLSLMAMIFPSSTFVELNASRTINRFIYLSKSNELYEFLFDNVKMDSEHTVKLTIQKLRSELQIFAD